MTLKNSLMAAAAAIGLAAGLSAPAAAENSPILGEVQAYSFSWCPVGWTALNGQILAIRDYTALYALLGTVYGGDGVDTFALPDLRGRSPIGYGTGAGLPAYALGNARGLQSATLSADNLPSHNHAVMASTGDPNLNSPTGAAVPTIPNPTREIYTDQPPTTATMRSGTIGASGAGDDLLLYQPSLAINYCMATGGNAAFPSRN